MVRRIGTPGDDVFEGTPGGDVFFGRDGDDAAFGGRGGDRLSGERGRDTLDGGNDRDVLSGGQGDDFLSGGEGSNRGARDRLSGDGGDDLIEAGFGDLAFGGSGDDLVLLAGTRAEGGRGEDSFDVGSVGDPFSPDGTAFLYGRSEIVDFERGADTLTIRAFEETAPGEFTRIDPQREIFARIDSNDDGLIAAGDEGVSMGRGGLAIDFEQVFEDLPYARGENSLTLTGISGLSSDDFAPA